MSNWVKKRTWDETSIEVIGSSFAVKLDDKYLYTPNKRQVLLPTAELAQAVADEWSDQSDIIEPSKMPYSRLVNSVFYFVQKHTFLFARCKVLNNHL